jgi:hypothetical protein
MNNTHTSSRLAGAALIALLPVVATAALQAQSGKGDGIKVHGHWTIDVRNADGVLSSHNEFENALEPSGGVALTGLLARNLTPTAWRLDLIGTSSGGPCVKAAPTLQFPTLTFRATAAIFDQASNTWMFTPAPGAPTFNFGPYGQQTITQAPFAESLSISDPEGDPFTLSLGGPPPGIPNLSITSQGQQGQTYVLQWDPTNVPPGTYGATITLQDNLGNATPYQLTAMVPFPADPTVSDSYPCSAVEPTTNISSDLANAWFPTLTFALVPAGSGQNLEISGNVTVTSSEAIEQVRSVLMTTGSGPLPFSSRVLGTPIQVVPGQKVYVKVAFSFS